MLFNYIDPTFSIFGLEITWYSVCILVGVVLAVWAGIVEGKKIGIPSDDIYWGLIIVFPCAIVGARLWYILFNLDQSWTFKKIIGLEGGLAGLAIQGGIIAAMIAIIIYCWKRKISLYRILDVVAPGFLIGQICGRWGNFFNQEVYGHLVTNPSWQWFPFAVLLDNGEWHYALFFYEFMINLAIFTLLFILLRKVKTKGYVTSAYLVAYGTIRFCLEPLRESTYNLMIFGCCAIFKISISIFTCCKSTKVKHFF